MSEISLQFDRSMSGNNFGRPSVQYRNMNSDFGNVISLSLSLSLSHTHTHTHTVALHSFVLHGRKDSHAATHVKAPNARLVNSSLIRNSIILPWGRDGGVANYFCNIVFIFYKSNERGLNKFQGRRISGATNKC
jgi:hypothetical protein